MGSNNCFLKINADVFDTYLNSPDQQTAKTFTEVVTVIDCFYVLA